MKLATLKDGTRDGKLVVVSKDLTRYCAADNIAPTLQHALDNWAEIAPRLEALYTDVQHEAVPCERFHEREAHSPLPRAYQWADGSAYINHVELVRKARGAEVPESFYHDPLMYQGGSDSFLAPRDDIPLGDTKWGCGIEGPSEYSWIRIVKGKREKFNAKPSNPKIPLEEITDDMVDDDIRCYRLTAEDVGSKIKVQVCPIREDGLRGESKTSMACKILDSVIKK